MYERILLPTDGSPAMGSTIEQCLHQATTNEATVHVLYVVDVRSFMMLPDETANQVAAMLEQAGQSAVDAIGKQLDEADIAHVEAVHGGIPHEVILTYADDEAIDLIVMGTHGRTGDTKRVLGSVAEEVIRNADIPVLTVRMSEIERQRVEEEIPEEQQRYLR